MTHPFNKMNQWVGSPIDYRTGKKAEEALAATNDNRYWNDETGSILVDKERWQQAQRYESDTWMITTVTSNIPPTSATTKLYHTTYVAW